MGILKKSQIIYGNTTSGKVLNKTFTRKKENAITTST